MLKKYIKILSVLLITLPFLNQTGCKLPEETEPELPPYSYETGMWLVGNLNTGGDARFVKGFILNGVQYALLSDGAKGIEIIDISNPQNPGLSGNYHTNGFVKEAIFDSIGNNKYIFVSDEVSGLHILNVTNPSAAYTDTILAYTGGVNSAYLKNGYLFTATGFGTVKILNLNSLPDSVYEAGTYTPKNSVNHIEISGTYAYLAEGALGMEIAEIINESSLSFVSALNTSGNCYDIKIANNLAYIADGTTGVAVINISNPSQPYVVSFTNTESDVRGIDYTPNFLLSAEYDMGAEVFNIFNPIYPNAFGYYEAPGYCYGVHFFKNKILIANGQYGLLILRF